MFSGLYQLFLILSSPWEIKSSEICDQDHRLGRAPSSLFLSDLSIDSLSKHFRIESDFHQDDLMMLVQQDISGCCLDAELSGDAVLGIHKDRIGQTVLGFEILRELKGVTPSCKRDTDDLELLSIMPMNIFFQMRSLRITIRSPASEKVKQDRRPLELGKLDRLAIGV